jgi:hypothetical protein
MSKYKILFFGTTGRTRTDTELPQMDFESIASTSFATVACVLELILNALIKIQQYKSIQIHIYLLIVASL